MSEYPKPNPDRTRIGDAVKNNRGCPSCSAQSLWGRGVRGNERLCDGNYQTTVGPSGDFTCHDDDCAGHDECGDGGTCVDLSVAESGPAGKFTCTCHAVMRSLSMEVLMVVTPVRVSVAALSVWTTRTSTQVWHSSLATASL